MSEPTTTDVHTDSPLKPRRLKNLKIARVAMVKQGANQHADVLLFKSADVEKALWSTAEQNKLPASSFAYVAPDGTRHLPYKNAEGKPDAAHVRNALARLDQTAIPAAAKASAKRKLLAAAKTLGIDAQKDLMGMPMDDKDEQDEPPPLTLEQRQQTRQLWQQWSPLWCDFCDTVYDIMDYDDDDGTYAPLLMESIDQFRTQAQSLLDGLGLLAKAAPLWTVCDDVVKAGAVMAADRKRRLQEAIATLQAILDEAAPKEPAMMKGHRMAERGHEPGEDYVALKKRADIAEARIKELEDELVKAKMTPEEQEAAYLATLPEAVKKQHEADKIEKAELRKKLEDAEERADRTDYIQKAVALGPAGVVADDDWALIRLFDRGGTLTKEQGARALHLLTSASEVFKQSALSRPMGHNQTPASGSAAERIEKAAKDKAAASNGQLTYEQAYDQVIQGDQALYAQMRAEAQRR